MEQWRLDAIVHALEERRSTGEAGAALDDLQQAAGVGPQDLADALEVLRQQGRVGEVEPGVWELRGPVPDRDDDEPEPQVAAPATASAASPAPGALDGGRRPRDTQLPPRAEPDVRLTRAMVTSMGAEALGKLILAGVEDPQAAGGFVLRIS